MTVLRPGCKINLGLSVTGKLPDGYHTLETLFYPLPYPADELRIEPGAPGRFELQCSLPELACEDNLLFRAWKAFGAVTGIRAGYRARLIKRIPAGAGLGGGSSNAASLLAWLNQRAGDPLDSEALSRTAFALGADVPFFLINRPCLARGAGETLEEVGLDGEGRWLVLVWPGICASTAQVFRRRDELVKEADESGKTGAGVAMTKPGASEPAKQTGLTKGGCVYRKTISASAIALDNDLEQAAIALWPQLATLRAELIEYGADEVSISGSGASFFGIFVCREQAQAAARQLRKSWPRVYCMQLRNFGM